MKSKFLTAILAIAIAVCIIFPAIAQEGEIDIEVYTGPEFKEGDDALIAQCVSGNWTFFPADLVFNGPSLSSSNECPQIEFFGHEQNLCWVLNTYRLISPGITLSIIIYSIFHL